MSGICDNYVLLSQLCKAIEEDNCFLEQTFKLIIYFNVIMWFKSFQEYPNELFGGLELHFIFNKGSLVVKQYDVVKSIKAYARMYLQDLDDEDSKTVTGCINQFDGPARYWKKYAQIGDLLAISIDVNKTISCDTLADISPNADNITLIPEWIQIDEVYSTINVYKMYSSALEVQKQEY